MLMLRDKLNVVEETLESQLTCILEKYGRDDNDVQSVHIGRDIRSIGA
ncbi:hypothetical protein N9T67_00350 [bacterium]|nr:hypothetical protein [bacterium]MDG1783697.1 hypothetical protein [Porticoccaceae bacterium]